MPLNFAYGFYIFHFSYRKLNSGLFDLHLQFSPCYELNSHSKSVCRSPQSPAPGNAIFFAHRIAAHVTSQDEVLMEQRGMKVQHDSCPNKKRDLDRHKDNAMSVLCPTEAEIKVMYLQIKEHQGLPGEHQKLEETRKTPPLQASGGAQPQEV